MERRLRRFFNHNKITKYQIHDSWVIIDVEGDIHFTRNYQPHDLNTSLYNLFGLCCPNLIRKKHNWNNVEYIIDTDDEYKFPLTFMIENKITYGNLSKGRFSFKPDYQLGEDIKISSFGLEEGVIWREITVIKYSDEEYLSSDEFYKKINEMISNNDLSFKSRDDEGKIVLSMNSDKPIRESFDKIQEESLQDGYLRSCIYNGKQYLLISYHKHDFPIEFLCKYNISKLYLDKNELMFYLHVKNSYNIT